MGKKSNSIKVSGEDINKPVHSFKVLYEKFGIAQCLQEAIKKSGFKAPTAVQSQVIPLMLDKREIICSAPTGSGKTLAFALPIVHQLREPQRIGSFRALILAPTRELAKQIHRETLWISQGTNLRIHHLKDVKEAAKKFNPESLLKYDVLVTTPNRLSALLQTDPPSISLNKLQWLIIDECDRIFDMGFKDDLTVIYKHCLESNCCRRAMFSATLEQNLVKWAQLQMNDVATVIVGGKNKTSSSVDQKLVYVGTEYGKVLAFRELIQSGIEVPVLIFVETKDKAKFLAKEFLYDNLNIDFIHSERDQKDRDSIVVRFREGKIWFLVCTDLMGRGIDFKGVNVVINYDCPKTYVSYIHRIGRTGRAGRKGRAITFVSDADKRSLPQIAKVMKRSNLELTKEITDLLAKSNKRMESKKGESKNKNSKNKNSNVKNSNPKKINDYKSKQDKKGHKIANQANLKLKKSKHKKNKSPHPKS